MFRKCLFSISCILFLSFILQNKKLKKEKNDNSMIINWHLSESVHEFESFFKSFNIYQKFVSKIFSMANLLNGLDNKAIKKEKRSSLE